MTPTAGLTTTEAGGTATFTVVLNTQPTADVTIALSSSDTTEGTVGPASLTFTTANWNVAQTVTVTGVDDAVDDGDVAYTIVTAPATSADANYSGVNAADVAVTNTDNDAAGHHGHADDGPDDDRGRRDGDLHGRAQHAADGGRDDRAELERHDRRHGRPGEPDLYDRELERGADGDGDGRRRRRWSTATVAYTIVTAPATSTRPELQRRRRGRRRGDQHRQRRARASR